MSTESRSTHGENNLVCRGVGRGSPQCGTPQSRYRPERWTNRTGLSDCYGPARSGTIPFFTALQPNWPVKPFTLFVNKADFRSERHAQLTWGPAQAGIAEGILTAVQRRIVTPEQVDEYLIIASVWVDWNADNDEEVYQNNKDAALRALERAFSSEPGIDDLLARLGHAQNPFLTRSHGEAEV